MAEARVRPPAPSLVVAGSLWSVSAPDRRAAVDALVPLGLERLHWDTTDGVFARAGGFAPQEAAELAAATGTTAEAHIMAEQPLYEVDAWAEFCDTVIVHAESAGWEHAVARLESRGCRPALAISPGTPASAVPAGLDVLCMSITPGEAGAAFDETVLAKVAELRASAPGRRIGLDGGMRRDLVDRVVAAGATWVVVGGNLFGEGGGERWGDVLQPDASIQPNASL